MTARYMEWALAQIARGAEMLSEEWQRNIASTIAHHAECVAQNISIAAGEHGRPSAVYRPALSIDGDHWCALYGANLQDGVAGFGPSPELAMWDFDKAWVAKLPLNQEAKS